MTGKDLFLEYVKAYNSKDVSGMLAFFDEACVFENITADGDPQLTRATICLSFPERKAGWPVPRDKSRPPRSRPGQSSPAP